MRRIVYAFAIIVSLVGFLAALGVYRALDADALRRAVESRLSNLLGQAVTIGAMRVSVFPVPAVVGSRIVVGRADQPELALERIRIVPRARTLLRGPLVVREVMLEGLAVRVVRDRSGRWKLPAVVPAPGADAGSGIVVERVRLIAGRILFLAEEGGGALRQTSSIDQIEGAATAAAGRLMIAPLRGRVVTAAVNGEAAVEPREARMDVAIPEIKSSDLAGVFGLAAAALPDSVSLPKPAAVSLSIRLDREKSRLAGKGSVKAPEAGVYSLRLLNLEAPLRTDGNTLTFEPATFTMYGGVHRGTFTIDLSRSPSRWAIDSQVTGVHADQFLSALSGGTPHLAGMGSAAIVLHAPLGEPLPQSLEGRMAITVANGIVREFPLLAAINRALRLAEGDSRDTRFERLAATLLFAGRTGQQHVTTNDIVLVARDVRVEAGGRIGFDRSLDLRGEAILSPEKSAEAIRSVRELSGLRNDRGEVELPLTITGMLDNPAIGIDLTSIIGRSLKEELRRRLRRLLEREFPN